MPRANLVVKLLGRSLAPHIVAQQERGVLGWSGHVPVPRAAAQVELALQEWVG